MSAFKSLTSQDVIITPFVVNKSFTFEGSASFVNSNVFIERLLGKNITGSFNILTEPTTGTTGSNGYSSSYYQRNIYNSIKQLYYSNELPNPEGTYIVTDYNNNIVESNLTTNVHSRFDNYLQTTLSQSRYFPTASNTEIYVLSLPSQLFGDYINPNSFSLTIKNPASPSTTVTYYDDGEGSIYKSGSSDFRGVITYQHGLIAFTQPGADSAMSYFFGSQVSCSFQSARTIYETQVKCTIRENEFNFSLNPSLISGSTQDGYAYDFVTGSSGFSPYVTTVGLYNENQELLAVAKLAQPLPTSRTTDMSILVNIDR